MPPKKKAKSAKAKKVKKAKKSVDEGDIEKPREFKRQKSCPDCTSNNVSFDIENEAMICGDCGSIFEEFISVEGSDEINLF